MFVRQRITSRGNILLLAALAASPAFGEFKPGATVPGFVLPATDGTQVEVSTVGAVLSFKRADSETKPVATVIHLLQPDCLQCRAQLKELQALSDRFSSKGVVVLGIAHRGELKDLQKLGKDLALTFPLAQGTGSEIAKQFAAGDTLGISDRSGVVKFAQVGFGKGDESLWIAAIDELLAGKPVTKASVDRERLAVGDRFPAIELPSVETGKPLALVGKDGRLTFLDEQGKETQPKGAVGFFSRY